jgi:hypothetical protein
MHINMERQEERRGEGGYVGPSATQPAKKPLARATAAAAAAAAATVEDIKGVSDVPLNT